MLDNLSGYRVLLASNSPRRKELLGGLDIDFEVVSLPDIDESYPNELKGGDIPAYISQTKAKSYSQYLNDNTLLITADTIVWKDGKVFGKPKSAQEAKDMLNELSGSIHHVFTGVTVETKTISKTFFSKTEVTFAKLSQRDIEHYVERYAPMDKAGSYGIQEWIGFVGVESISGSYFNVMGLPVHKLYKVLSAL